MLGNKYGYLQENVSETFGGTSGQTPVTQNWGDLSGTAATRPFYWDGLSGPNANPGWGVYVSRTGTASALSSGTLHFSFLGVEYHTYATIRLLINQYGYSCQ
jgi:hypothetical protein